MRPDDTLEARVRAAAKMLRGSKRMTVSSAAGTDLTVDMTGAATSASGAGPIARGRSRTGRAGSW